MDNIEEVLRQYIENVIVHREETTRDPDKANKAADNILKCYEFIKQYPGGLDYLVNLLTHENNSVKLASASHTLNYRSDLAEKVLLELSKRRGEPTAFTANIVLEEWKKGNLKY